MKTSYLVAEADGNYRQVILRAGLEVAYRDLPARRP
jgi:hypothetical protein